MRSSATRSRFPVLFLSLLLTLSLSAPALAQVGGSVSGTVKDPSGGIVPGVTLTITNALLGTTFTTVTDTQGFYTFPKLPVGRYDLTMTLDGFKQQKRSGI